MDEARAQLAQRGDAAPGFDDEALSLMQVRTRPPEFFGTQGLAAAEARDLEKALFMFELAVEIAPRSVPGRVSLGRTQMVTGRLDDAVVQLARAIELDPENVLAVSSLGQAHEMRGDDESALPYYRRWAELAPSAAEPHLLSGNANMRLARYLDAENNYRALSQIGDGSAGWLRVGLSQLARGACEGGLDSLERSAGQLGDDPILRMARARAYSICEASTVEDHRAALEEAEALYSRWPAEETATTLAMAMAANGDTQEAESLTRQLIFAALSTGRVPLEDELLKECLALFGRGLPAARPFAPGSPMINPARIRP